MACFNEAQEGEREEELRVWAAESIRYHVWSGFYDPDEVLVIVDEDINHSGVLDEAWLRGAIRREFSAKRKAERAWPKETDCDRLERAFDAIESRGIVCPQEPSGFTQSDGFEDVFEEYTEAGGKKSKLVGYCFYTQQDLEGVMGVDGGDFYFAYGSFSDSKQKGVEVGQLLREEFEKVGFEVVWDGSLDSRVMLKGFRWQRRY